MQGGGAGGAPPGGGRTARRRPVGAPLPAPPPPGARVRGALGTTVLRGAPRGHVVADAPGGALPRLVSPAPARMQLQHTARFLMDDFPLPLEAPPPPCFHMPGGPRGLRPAASLSRRRSAAAPQVRAAARRARSAWSMGCPLVPDAGAWAGVSAVAAEVATKATRAPRGGSSCPMALPRVAPGRQMHVPEARRAGAAALSS